MGQYSYLNAQAVLDEVEACISRLEEIKVSHYLDYTCMRWGSYGFDKPQYKISAVCNELAIFDWWNEYLSMSQLLQMKKFLVQAIKMGFTGKVSFKVGASGCSHGMWAHKLESTDGYDPRDGEVLYHSFRAGDNYWDVRINGNWLAQEDGYKHTLAQVKQALA